MKIPLEIGIRSFPWKKMAAVFLIPYLGACLSFDHRSQKPIIPPGRVVFTFDDGPNIHGDTTARLLDILKKHEVRAMFALLGENARQNPALVRRIRDEGHIIVNHGYSDRFAVWMGDRDFYNNLIRGEAAITAVLGEEPEPRFYRPQGGFYLKRQERIWREAGYTLVPGSIRIYDAILSAADKDRAITTLMRILEKKGGGIILLHDARDSHARMEARLAKRPRGSFNRSWIPDMVEEVIILLKEKGYTMQGFDALYMPDRID
ncbi:MAG: polysaccharide deacetylase family protein [Spirochaetaceae bacterium]|jgi:peptidoglycan/xylan/chitin deacetylase (PgdA/CDA1 family)|nr:polysaccharide deacetylase family protein [Spirochaetaceae bacterium]